MCFYFLTISSLFLCIVFFTKHIVSKHIYIYVYINERVFYVSGESERWCFDSQFLMWFYSYALWFDV